jgi:serine/threonine protein kinase
MEIRIGQRIVVACHNGGGNEIKFFGGNGKCLRIKLDDPEDKSLWWSVARHVISVEGKGKTEFHIPVSGRDFRIIRLIGRGGFGSVYKVKQTGKQNHNKPRLHYALKIIKKGSCTSSALVERQMAERARHPFVVQLRYSFQSARNFYMVSDFYGGGSLHYHLRKSKAGFFSEEEVEFWAAEILLALEHLHSVGILYRDLKLENVLLDKEGHIGVTDFGLSTDHTDSIFAPPDTKENDCSQRFGPNHIGTPFYLAPEVLKESSTSHTVDLWAFGVLLHELMVGSTPFKGSCRKQLYQNIISQPLNLEWNLFTSGKRPGIQRKLSKPAVFVLEGLLEKDPTRRLNCRELKECIFFQRYPLDASVLKKSFTPIFRPGRYDSEVNIDRLVPLLSRGNTKKTISSVCCGGPKFIPGFTYVRTPSKHNVGEETDSSFEVNAGFDMPERSRSAPSAHIQETVKVQNDLMISSASNSLVSLTRPSSMSSITSMLSQHLSPPRTLGWDSIHSIF